MKFKASTTLSVAASALALGIASISFNASAANATVYNGSSCQDRDSYGTRSNRQLGFVENRSSAVLFVDCPIDNHNHINRDGVWFVTINVYRSSAGGSEKLSCSLMSKTSDGRYVVGLHSVSANGFGNQTLYPTISTSSAFGTYYLSCSLPRYSSILNYTVMEKGDDT